MNPVTINYNVVLSPEIIRRVMKHAQMGNVTQGHLSKGGC